MPFDQRMAQEARELIALRDLLARLTTATDEQIKAVLPPMSIFLRESLYDYEQRHVTEYVIQCVRAVLADGVKEVPDAQA